MTPKIKAVREAVAYVRGVYDAIWSTFEGHEEFLKEVEVLEKHVASLTNGEAHREQWKMAVTEAARGEGLESVADTMWNEDDPFEIHDAASDAYDDGDDPFEFVQTVFAEDIAKAQLSREQVAQAEEENDAPPTQP